MQRKCHTHILTLNIWYLYKCIHAMCIFKNYTKWYFLKHGKHLYKAGKRGCGISEHKAGRGTHWVLLQIPTWVADAEVWSGSDELTPLFLFFLPTVIDALFQRCTEGEGRFAKTVKGAGRVLTPPILTVRGVLALIHICKGHHRHWLQYEHLPSQGLDTITETHVAVSLSCTTSYHIFLVFSL